MDAGNIKVFVASHTRMRIYVKGRTQVYILYIKQTNAHAASFAYKLYNLSSRIITMFSICLKSIIIVIILYVMHIYKKSTPPSDKDYCYDKILYILFKHLRIIYMQIFNT